MAGVCLGTMLDHWLCGQSSAEVTGTAGRHALSAAQEWQ
jgi:hypothetical protein